MKQTIDNASQFRDAFRECGRESQFSHQAFDLLFDYFEECNPDMDLDCIAICCQYSEDTVQEIAGNYDIDLTDIDTDGMDKDDIEAAQLEIVLDYLNNHTSVVGETSSGIVYADF
jgi:hypothetical protein